jgi:hypothetical protein
VRRCGGGLRALGPVAHWQRRRMMDPRRGLDQHVISFKEYRS